MKITSIELIPISIPTKHGGKKVMRGIPMPAFIESLVLKLHTDEGLTGFSECGDTSSWYQGETQTSIMTMIGDFFAPQILLGEDPTKIEKIVGRMDTMARDNNQAKATVDFALHDLVGKMLRVPVSTLLGGKTIDRIPLGLVINAPTPQAAVEKAQRVLAEGFHFIKVKSTTVPKEDIAIVDALRKALGDEVEIFVDVNGAWTYDQALAAIRGLEPYNLSKIEQPLPEWDIEGMARLRGKVTMPVYADESARELHHLHELITRRAADGLMIKIQKAGGLLKAQRWLTMARLANMPVICGCMASTGVEASPAAHLLAANEWISRFPQENAGPLHLHQCLKSADIKDDLALNPPRYEGGYLYPPTGPGLGVELNEELLARWITPGRKIQVIGGK